MKTVNLPTPSINNIEKELNELILICKQKKQENISLKNELLSTKSKYNNEYSKYTEITNSIIVNESNIESKYKHKAKHKHQIKQILSSINAEDCANIKQEIIKLSNAQKDYLFKLLFLGGEICFPLTPSQLFVYIKQIKQNIKLSYTDKNLLWSQCNDLLSSISTEVVTKNSIIVNLFKIIQCTLRDLVDKEELNKWINQNQNLQHLKNKSYLNIITEETKFHAWYIRHKEATKFQKKVKYIIQIYKESNNSEEKDWNKIQNLILLVNSGEGLDNYITSPNQESDCVSVSSEISNIQGFRNERMNFLNNSTEEKSEIDFSNYTCIKVGKRNWKDINSYEDYSPPNSQRDYNTKEKSSAYSNNTNSNIKMKGIVEAVKARRKGAQDSGIK